MSALRRRGSRRASGAPRAFHLLAKPTGAVCNLDCSYCFFLSKEMLYPGSRFRMADELLEAYLRQLIEAHAGVPEVTIAWQGGEPTLMGVEFFRRSVELADDYLQPGQSAIYTIQTNGTLLDEEWAAFFERARLPGRDLDRRAARDHDTYRVNKGGKGSFDQVIAGSSTCRPRVSSGTRSRPCTPPTATTAARSIASCATTCGARFVQFIPIIERVAEADADGTVPWTSWRDRPLYVQEGDVVTGRSVTGEQYGRFLIDVFEEWVRHDIGEVYVQMFDVSLANWVGEPPGLCVHSETCGLALALEHTGDLYSCDHFVEPAYKLGNITETHDARARRLAAAAAVRARQARRAAAVLPRLRRPLRLPRRLPQGPLHRDARRRARPELPLRRLQGLLPPRRRADADMGHCSPRPRAVRDRRSCTQPKTRPRPQRPLHLRLGPQVEALSRRRARAALRCVPRPRSPPRPSRQGAGTSSAS